MTFSEYLGAVRRQWSLILTLTTVSLLVAAGFTFTRTPSYSADTTLFVSTGSRQSDIADLQSGSSFAQSRLTSYATVITSPLLLQQVVQRLGLPYDARTLAERVTAENPANTVLLEVTVSDSDPDQAANIANALAAEFPGFVADLETIRGTASPVRVKVTQPAYPPDSPDSPNVPLYLGFGLLMGLTLGLGGAVLRGQLDATVTTPEQVEQAAGTVTLARVPLDPLTPRRPVVGQTDQGPRAEAYRALRTNVQFASIDDPARLIVVTSAVPGEGKTVTACNLALALAAGGSHVVLIDADLRQPSVAHTLGISSAAGLTDVLLGRHDLSQVLVRLDEDGLSVLPSGSLPPNPSELLGSLQMAALLDGLRAQADFVVIDTPPLLPVTDAAVLARRADGAVIIARHGRTRRDQLTQAAMALTAVKATLLGVVLNGTELVREEAQGYATRGAQTMDRFPLGPRDSAVASPAAVFTGDPMPEPTAANITTSTSRTRRTGRRRD